MDEKNEQTNKKTTPLQVVLATVIIIIGVVVINAFEINLSEAGIGSMIGSALPIGLIVWAIYCGGKKPNRTLLGFSYYFIITSFIWLAIKTLLNM